MRLLLVVALGCSSSGEAPTDKPADKPIDKPIVREVPDAAAVQPPDASTPDAAPEPPPDASKPEPPRKPANTAGKGSGEVKRGLEPEVVRKVVMANLAGIRECYTSELAKRPGLDGKIGVTFVIGEDGSVINATVPVGDDVVGSCINALIKKSKFPKPPGGGTVTINYPFVFTPEE